MSLAIAQRVCWWIAGASALMALLTGLGRGPFPILGPPWVVPGHLFVLVLGIGFGWMAQVRQREIDVERWRILADDDLTSGEREYAHKNAESSIARAMAAFLLAPLFLAGWLTYQIQDLESPFATQMIALSAFAGYTVGLAVGWWRGRLEAGRPTVDS